MLPVGLFLHLRWRRASFSRFASRYALARAWARSGLLSRHRLVRWRRASGSSRLRRSAFCSGFSARHLRMNSRSALRLASFLHLGEQYFVLLLLAVNVFLQMWHVLLWFAMSCCFLLCGPFDGVALADAVGGDGVVAAVFDVACLGCVVDGLVVDAGEGFGLAEGDHVWVPGVDGFGGHVVSFRYKNKSTSFLFLFLLRVAPGLESEGFSFVLASW